MARKKAKKTVKSTRRISPIFDFYMLDFDKRTRIMSEMGMENPDFWPERIREILETNRMQEFRELVERERVGI